MNKIQKVIYDREWIIVLRETCCNRYWYTAKRHKYIREILCQQNRCIRDSFTAYPML